jgi:hypothetical protein
MKIFAHRCAASRSIVAVEREMALPNFKLFTLSAIENINSSWFCLAIGGERLEIAKFHSSMTFNDDEDEAFLR